MCKHQDIYSHNNLAKEDVAVLAKQIVVTTACCLISLLHASIFPLTPWDRNVFFSDIVSVISQLGRAEILDHMFLFWE